jgi:hypothetical protein
MTWLRRCFALLILVGLIAGRSIPAIAQQQTSREFPESGHMVVGEFLAFYQSVSDPLLLYGFPITEEFVDPTSNLRMQYFQKARFELHEDAPAGQRVQISRLGSLVYQKEQVQPVAMPITPACRTFTTSGTHYYVCYAFLSFFDAHGGVAQFGNPISDYVKEGDLYVQYFEKARFEWHPELPADEWVKLADIGRIQFDQSGRSRGILGTNPAEFKGASEIVHLQAHAFVSKAVIKANSRQTLFVIVQDQNYQPISGAQVTAKVVLLSGQQQTIPIPITDENGIAQATFDVGSQGASQMIQIKVQVTSNSFTSQTSAWYQIWW